MMMKTGVDLNISVDGDGPPLIFIHGYTTTSNFWWHQIPDLAKHYRTVRFDLRGHGDSGKPENVPYTIEGFTQDVRDVMDTLKIDSAMIFGLSMGGAVLMRFALDYPQRVVGMGLIGTTAHGLGPAVQSANVLARIEQVGAAAASQEVIESSFSRHTDSAIVEWARREVIKTPHHVAVPAICSLDAFDVRSELKNLQKPTLIVVGAEDKITPVASSRLLHHEIAGSELHIVPKAAHFPMLERSHTFNQIALEFLRAIPY